VVETVHHGNESFGMFDVVVDVGLSISGEIAVAHIKTRPK